MMKSKLAQMDEQSFLLLSFIVGYLIDPIFCIRRYPKTPEKQKFYKTQFWKGICNKILKRDNNECQHCGEKENLHIHHKTDVKFFNPPARYLITLCASCHRLEHHRLKTVNEMRKLAIYKLIIFLYVSGTITITTLIYS